MRQLALGLSGGSRRVGAGITPGSRRQPPAPLAESKTSAHAGAIDTPSTPKDAPWEGSVPQTEGVAPSGSTSSRLTPLERKKNEALELAAAHFPDAERITPQLIGNGELCVHVWRNGAATLHHTEVFV